MSSDEAPPISSRLTQSIKSTVTSSLPAAESELNRWRRTFDRFAQEEKDGKKCASSMQVWSLAKWQVSQLDAVYRCHRADG